MNMKIIIMLFVKLYIMINGYINESNYYDFEVDKIFDRLFMLCQIRNEFDFDNAEILKEINEH